MEQLTYGQKLVGLTFNPSADPKVQEVKEKCAELIDLIQESWTPFMGNIPSGFYDDAIKNIVLAQMLTVKGLTWTD